MPNLDRDDIHILARNSNWPKVGVEQALKENVYNNTAAWQRFLQIFFIGLGVCFTSAGIIFFLAYNWDDLGKFAKMAMVAGAMLVVVLVVLFAKASQLVKNTLLTGAAVMVGGLFAVYGQIYQTGADTYELFMAWTAFVTLWVLAAGFAPLWLLYITLVNTTLILYLGQMAHSMETTTMCLLLFVLNMFFLAGAVLAGFVKPGAKSPMWFTNTLALAVVAISTTGIVDGIFDKEGSLALLLPAAIAAYSLAIWYGINAKRVFYLAIVSFSVVIIISAVMINASQDTGMFLMVSFFIIAAVTSTIWQIVKLQKKWADA